MVLGMYDGGIYSNKWAIAYETSITAATNSVSVNVDLATDVQWSISVIGTLGSIDSSPATLKIYLNDDTDDDNYEGSFLSYTSGTVALEPEVTVGPEVYRATAAGDVYTEIMLTQFSAARHGRMRANSLLTTSDLTDHQVSCVSWANPDNKRITKITFTCSQNMSPNTRIVVRRYV